mmetsp:Transcript_47301/g.132094  ORF Transcript_47301/g.132094 Transcript_47301/m.132094 type:complete len:247 (+) Transcript_47301:1338-2078(+)
MSTSLCLLLAAPVLFQLRPASRGLRQSRIAVEVECAALLLMIAAPFLFRVGPVFLPVRKARVAVELVDAPELPVLATPPLLPLGPAYLPLRQPGVAIKLVVLPQGARAAGHGTIRRHVAFISIEAAMALLRPRGAKLALVLASLAEPASHTAVTGDRRGRDAVPRLLLLFTVVAQVLDLPVAGWIRDVGARLHQRLSKLVAGQPAFAHRETVVVELAVEEDEGMVAISVDALEEFEQRRVAGLEDL